MNSGEFNKEQKEVMAERVHSAERTGYFAGAAFSLSFTLLGFLISQPALVSLVRSDAYLTSALVFGWAFLSLAVVASIFPRLWSARWLFNSSWHLYLSGFTTFENEEVKKVHATLKPKFEQRAGTYSSLFSLVTDLVYVGAIIGFACLAFFLIRLAILLL